MITFQSLRDTLRLIFLKLFNLYSSMLSKYPYACLVAMEVQVRNLNTYISLLYQKYRHNHGHIGI